MVSFDLAMKRWAGSKRCLGIGSGGGTAGAVVDTAALAAGVGADVISRGGGAGGALPAITGGPDAGAWRDPPRAPQAQIKIKPSTGTRATG